MIRLAFALLLALAVTLPARAGDPAASGFTPAQRAQIVAILRQALTSDPSILRDAVTALQADEAARHDASARDQLARLGPALTAQAGDPVEGNPQGDVTVVEFYDLRCPYCRRMLPVMAELLKRDARVRVVLKDIPILGPDSVLGARAVLAAQRQGGYAKLQSAIMQGGKQITPDTLHAAATASGLDWDTLQHDMADPAITARIEANLDLAHQLGVEGTPAFVIGRQMLPGALDLAELQGAIAAAR